MPYKYFTMSTSFTTSLGTYPFPIRCEMTKEAGYDAIYQSLLNDKQMTVLEQLPAIRERYNLDVAGVYTILDIDGDENTEKNKRLRQIINTIEGCNNIEIALQANEHTILSDPAGDTHAIRWLKKLLAIAEKRNITLSLYPHRTFWLERIEDALRLCQHINHPLLKVVFCGIHWFSVDGTDLPARLEAAAPYLHSVNLNGSSRVQWSYGFNASIEPLDEGELDNFVIVGLLKNLGYKNMIGIQGFGVGGDVYTKLRKSLTTLRDIEHRLEKHPHWANIDFEA